MSDAEEALAFQLRAVGAEFSREVVFAAPRKWRTADVVEWAHGPSWQTPDRSLRVVRDTVPAGEVPSAVLLPALSDEGVAGTATQDARPGFLRSVRGAVYGEPAQPAVLLSGASGRDGSTRTARDACRRPRQGLGQGPSDGAGQPVVGGRCHRLLVGSRSRPAGAGPCECASLLTLRGNGSHANLRLGERERQLPGRERLRRDVSLVPSEVRQRAAAS
jgi:hypothetical protein